jgi:hypothetical protein
LFLLSRYLESIFTEVKIKIGTQMDPRVFRSLKVAAARQGRPVASVVEDAVSEYLAATVPSGRQALLRFAAKKPRPVASASLREVLRADYYEQ